MPTHFGSGFLFLLWYYYALCRVLAAAAARQGRNSEGRCFKVYLLTSVKIITTSLCFPRIKSSL